MLPLFLLATAKGEPIQVELKNNVTINGYLVDCDSWMNLTLENVLEVDATGEHFKKFPQFYVHGVEIKGVRMDENIIDRARQKEQRARNWNNNNNSNNNQRRNYNNRYSANSSGGNRGNQRQR
ncbi:Lsm (Like Sm) protein involved in RNA processing [Komagataella phaffii CBS 7435]|uniref:LSM complex subunit LSM4 n=3 Tax=Komagataella TaxID=460517 RepID=C4QVC8_KOMPG|nr:Lsm (Like Sm) protein [Komagataella phaffii GS115]ANZ73795.1 BA75_01720T0 [Komagataella pastoris]CAH2445856.1 Lsm (Like Sm) protein involved in RNA processing [Komagataella phaffii CBS 7435]CAY67201.1 Lsm (Like Sm) protein [Komagataella phaffii GS115]SCV11763.1 Lsm (Like Sm) protein involved in RNA processing [Komagataella phaffii CBS 7435]